MSFFRGGSKKRCIMLSRVSNYTALSNGQAAPINTPVTSDQFWFLTKDRALSLPCPFNNEGNYVISLSQLVRWTGVKAEELGEEIYPGFAASEACDVKDPKQNVEWTVPEGGGGPGYSIM